MSDKNSSKNFTFFIILLNIILVFVSCALKTNNNPFGQALSIGSIVLLLAILAIVYFQNKDMAKPMDWLIIFIFLGILFFIIFFDITVEVLMSSFFFSLAIILTFWIIGKLLSLIWGNDPSIIYYNKEGGTNKTKTDVFNKPINIGYNVLIFQILRTITLSVFLMCFLWVLISSPFSFFGGSLYGGLMQLLISLPLMFLLSSFWNSGSNLPLILITAASFAAYMLSFMFPTLFANLWILSTTGSASAGASAISSFNSISPLSYYKSTYIVKTGQTERRTGPTYELISDDVVSSEFSVLGRLCDESTIVASITFQNRAKFELKDLSVQMSAIRSPYCFGADWDLCNICNVNFTLGGKGATYTEPINSLPKGVPKTVNVPFTTWLPADVMNQVCKIRSNVLVHYHTTSVFPMSFIDYNAYLISPKNIGNPLSTSSFGKVLLSMDVGQQPIVVNFDTKSNDQVLLKLAWSQKGDGLVNTPKIVLYLPKDLGECGEITNWESSFMGSLGTYSGIYGYNSGKTLLSSNTDFACSNYKNNLVENSELTVKDYCSNIFRENIKGVLNSNEAINSLLYFTPAYTSSFEGMPSFDDACEDLASRGYSICVADKEIEQNDILFCPISLSGVDVSEIDLSTYLIRADALYNFNAIRDEQFTVENCNAI
jgi:hypothetical protein